MSDITVKFTGNFKELIPMGFKFYKLFARNYKVYEKNQIWVWVGHGGYVEVRDLYHLSGYVIKAILEGTYPTYEEDVTFADGRFMFHKGDPKGCRINEEGHLISYHDFLIKNKSRFKTIEELWNWEYESGYCELLISKRHLDTVKEIAHMIEIIEE
jgi:hypothetical protein